ncbi:hypothetical protein BDP27DRAFT_1337310, partial [Rhodocollybia butyracea]
MKNKKSCDALMKAFMEHTKLPHSTPVADLHNAVEITSSSTSGVVNKLTPPYGTKGFLHHLNWVLDVYAYRHANSNDVTVIVLHSGSSSSSSTSHMFHYPVTYDSDLGMADTLVYHMDYTRNINMIGPDGKNPIPVELQYSETFTASSMSAAIGTTPYNGLWIIIDFLVMLLTVKGSGRFYGMSVFNLSFEVDTPLSI